MARSKAFEALMNEAGKTAKKGGDTLKKVIPIGAVKQAANQTDNHTDTQTDRQSIEHTDTQTDRQSIEHIDRQTSGHPNEHSDRQTDRQSGSHPFEDSFHWITQKQALILSYLINNKSRLTSLNAISEITSIPYGTVRGSITKLVMENCITKPSRYRRGISQGISYKTNDILCEAFKHHNLYNKHIGHSGEQSNEQSFRQTVFQTGRQTDTPLLSSSSSFIKEPTTCARTEITEILENHPEFGYWRSLGLTVRQIENWMQTASCNLCLMVQYLCYCRYDMVDNGIEESRQIKNVFNYFFRILEKSGCYPKPKGYKSYREKQIEVEREATKQAEREAIEAKELYRRKVEAEREKDFWDMMNDPDGDLYRQCFSQLNDFTKRKARTGGKGFEMSMRNVFDKILDGTEQKEHK